MPDASILLHYFGNMSSTYSSVQKKYNQFVLENNA